MVKYLKGVIIFIRLIRESLAFAYTSIVANKMRTFLSLLGVTIGVFAIISTLTVIDSLERNIANSLEELGSDVIYIQRYPWSGDYNTPWWKFRQRPSNRYDEMIYIQQHSRTTQAAAMGAGFSREIKYKSKVASSAYILAFTPGWEMIMPPKIDEGRYFSLLEAQKGSNVVVLGAKVKEELFGEESPVGKIIKIAGRPVRVIGSLQKEGENMLNITNRDNTVMAPYSYAQSMINLRYSSPDIAVKAKPGVSIEEVKAEITQLLRAKRRLKPVQEDNFALNELSILTNITKNIFGVIYLVGWIIGGFSILVGGFGIANIMFVSVKERTHIIGIQKALGAKNYFILVQFLAESVFLAVMGGAVGLLLIWIGSLIISSVSSFAITLTLGNIIMGFSVSATIGIIFGLVPAFIASALNPVVAINSK